VDKKNNEFLKRLLDTFRVEAQEHVNALSSGLIELEKAATAQKQLEITEAIFREAHSLKGAARAVNMTDIESLCQSLESVFAALKSQAITASAGLFDLLHEAVDSLGKLLSDTEGELASSEQSALAGLIERLKEASAGREVARQESVVRTQAQPVPDTRPPTPDAETSPRDIEIPPPTMAETVRVSTGKLNSILLQTEEMLSAKLASGQRIAELEELDSTLTAWEKEWRKIYPELQKLKHSLEKKGDRSNNDSSRLARLIEFLDWNQTQAKQLENKLAAAMRSAEHDNHSVGLMVDSLLEDTKRVMMVSFSTLLEAFPGMVRDLSRQCGKEAELVIQGGEVEIDRRILEEMKDPLIHLVRNSIEHGIETPIERQQRNKPPKGTVTLAIAQINSHIEILISDDGSGIDAAKIKAAAVRLGTLSANEVWKMPDSEALLLIFLSGISTSPIITDISGRGLGLAIVREKVDKVRGTISLETHPGTGTTFKLVLPMKVATFRGVIVRVAEHLFVLPTTNVERVVKVSKEEIKTVENRQTIELNGQAISLVRLEDALGLARQNHASSSESSLSAVILHVDGKHIAFLVDEVVNEQEVLVKNLGKQLLRMPNVAGATVFGTGRLVPVLNIRDLMKSAVQASVGAAKPAVVPVEKKKGKKPAVLVVEDSITARTLLKNILEATGYDLATAVDGIDAFTQLRSGEFDIVVSDVDMPRMNGFDLTAKIRADKKLVDLPVVLLTALESREHRERGIEVGANAYIVKSSFDQSNLLEVIRRLI
jgi:two-component system chemotaxis sensor kinase CheA